MVVLKHGVTAMSALVAGSLATLLLGAEAAAPAPVTIDAPLEVPSVHGEILPAIVVAPAPAAPPRAAAPAPAPAAPAPDRSEAFRDWSPKVAFLPKDLGQMGPSLKLALDNARNNDMAFCFREVEGSGPHSIRSSNLMLYLQTRENAVDVVEARVAHPGDLPAAVVNCACEVLRGMDLKVFFTVPGERYSYLYEIEA